MYTCPLPLEPSHPHFPSHPSRPSQNTRLSSLWYTATSHHCPLKHHSVYVDATFSLCPIHSLPHCVYKPVLYICISGGVGYMYSYDWFMLLYHRNLYSIGKIQKKKKTSHKNTIKQCQWNDDRSPPPLRYHGSGLVAKLCLTLVTPWTVAHQASLSLGFSRQEHLNRWPFPSLGIFPHQGIEPASSAWQVDSLPLSYQGSPSSTVIYP